MALLGWILGLGIIIILPILLGIWVLLGLRVINEYERGVRFTLGRYSGAIGPGLTVVLPILQSWERVDIRTKTIDVPDQAAITKDNVTVTINAVLYYKVTDAKLAIIEVTDFMYATSQIAQTTLRDVVGSVSLDELLTKRDEVSSRIQKIVDKATDPWGIKVESVELKHIEVPKEMQRVMARQAEAERERRSVIIKSEGEVTAAQNLSDAARNLTKFPGALHLRTLQTINDLSSDKSNTVVYALPKEILLTFKKLSGGKI
ncbi:MAG TPA: slipin family protein [Candidatus Nanoarchaeia archaeon]|nr:slipin family protein [Candidatus Nanoarchaeia archaeon]